MTVQRCTECGHALGGRWETLTRGGVNSLIRFYRTIGASGGDAHLQNDVTLTKSEYTNFYRLKYWDLVEATGGGRYKMTAFGVRFLAGRARIRKALYVMNNRVYFDRVHPENEFVTVHDIMASNEPHWLERCDYQFLRVPFYDQEQDPLPFESEDGDQIAHEILSPDQNRISRFVTFGASHVHEYDGKRIDSNVQVELVMPQEANPRDEICRLFGSKWSMEYATPRNAKYFSRGIVRIEI